MKCFFRYFIPVAVAATVFASCSLEITPTVQSEPLKIIVNASAEELENDNPDTKTYIGTYEDQANTILWGTAEYMKLAVTAGENTIFATSTEASANSFSGRPSATFNFSVSLDEANEYVYQGLYPASAAARNDNTNAVNYKVNLPAIQNATASSYDPAAFILVAKPDTFDQVQDTWVASFRRGTALNKITLKNFDLPVSINKVKITAEGKKLAGGRHFNLATGDRLDVYGTDATIDVLYATPLAGTSMDIWFTSWNAEIVEGEKLTIVAYTTDSKSYTKEIIVPAGKTIKFQEGCLNTLGANMSGIAPEVVATIEGDYVILAKHNTSYFALKGEANGTHIASVDYTGSTDNYAGVASIIWTIIPDGSAYKIKNGGNYIGWNGGSGSSANNAALIPEADFDDDKCLMTIDQSEGIYTISVKAEPTRILAKNTSSAYFAFYASTGQYSDIILVPATALEQVATPTFSPAAGEVNSGTEVTLSCATDGASIHYTIDGTDPTSSSATYSSPFTITTATTIKAIAIKDGMADSEIASAAYTVADAEKVYYVKVSSETSDWSGTYLIVSDAKSFTGAFSGASTNYGMQADVTVSDDKIESTSIVDAYAVTIAKSESSYSIETAENGFLSWTSGNSLNHTASVNGDNQRWSFTYDSGNVIIANASNNTRKLQYNSSNPRFACYTSSQQAVQLYKLEASTTPSVTWNLESIGVTTAPTKTTYTEGQYFDPTGMVVTGHFVDADDNTNTKDEDVTGYTISPARALYTSDVQVTITYQGKTTTQAITVNAAASPTLQYTLTPASGDNNTYAGNCDIVIDGITWNLTGNSTFQPWRIGGKSLNGVNRELYSRTALNKSITRIEITHGAASSITVNSMTVIVSKNADFSNPVSTLTPSFVANDTVTVSRPDGKDWSNCYYKIVYNVTVSVNSNKFLEFSEANFYGNN